MLVSTWAQISPSYVYRISSLLHQQLQYRTQRACLWGEPQSRPEALSITRIINYSLPDSDLLSVAPRHLNLEKGWWSRKAGAHLVQFGWTLGATCATGVPWPSSPMVDMTVEQRTKANTNTSGLKSLPWKFSEFWESHACNFISAVPHQLQVSYWRCLCWMHFYYLVPKCHFPIKLYPSDLSNFTLLIVVPSLESESLWRVSSLVCDAHWLGQGSWLQSESISFISS